MTAAPTVSPVESATGAPLAPLACAGTDLERLPTTARVVALTVDLGANADAVPAILDALATAHVRATFFATGDWARRYPDLLARVAAAGHRVGNHTRTHPHLPALDDAAVRSELASTEDAVSAATGRTTRPLFRFPFGERDARTLGIVNDAGWCAYRWTVDTLGWQGTSGGRSAGEVVRRVLGALQLGEIVLMHGGSHPTDRSTLDADALPQVLREVAARGYGFVRLDEEVGR